jgi:hypothetical protein
MNNRRVVYGGLQILKHISGRFEIHYGSILKGKNDPNFSALFNESTFVSRRSTLSVIPSRLFSMRSSLEVAHPDSKIRNKNTNLTP